MGTRPSSDNMDRTGVKAKEGNRSKAVAFPLETVTVSATSSQGAPSQRPSTAGPILPPSRPVAPTNLQVEMPREVLSLLQQPAAAQDPSDSFGQHVACLMRRLPENRQLKTQNYILYLLEMATPPNCPTELECLIENYKHQQTQCELGSIQMPPPQYLQHRSYMQSSSYLEALNTVYARIGQAYVAQSALRRAPGYTWQESVCGGTEHRQTAIPYTSQSAETIPRIQNM
ncbi:hypothetical protein GDO78_000582 [Eleutherodactylus coqui]|uniref:Uncharacterized protein n=1 Tax=Eleutherodactylus coqui TaxID=57060 RepID=A0A8J6FR28_ELECQ|nr:hypothetical protein GDO78_000582 [Eleutherodactylus coqui]